MRRSGSTSQTNKQNAGRGGVKASASGASFLSIFPHLEPRFEGNRITLSTCLPTMRKKPLISVDFYRPKCVDLTFGDFLTIIILKQGDYLVVEKVKT